MDNEKEATPTQIPDDPKQQAEAIRLALVKKAIDGDVEALDALRELRQEAVEVKLRKELFGV